MPSLSILMLTTNVHAGAGRAALRHHRGLLSSGYDSELWYLEGSTSEIGCRRISTLWLAASRWPRKRLRKFAAKYLADPEPGFKSLSIFPSGLVDRINSHRCDIVQLNWICDFLSIADIGKISKPIVWRFSDMWPLLGTQHYKEGDLRFYLSRDQNIKDLSKQVSEPRWLDRWIWNQKKNAWTKRIVVCTPSSWLTSLTRKSPLSKKWEIFTTGTHIDTDLYKPSRYPSSHQSMAVPDRRPLVIFGSRNLRDRRKGMDLMLRALDLISERTEVRFAAFGAGFHCELRKRNVIQLGEITSELALASLLSQATVLVIPSRQDNLPQLALEALSCGCPVVGFNIGGISDLVKPGTNGRLAEPFLPESLAQEVIELIRDDNYELVRERSRAFAEENFSVAHVMGAYRLAYETAISTSATSE